MSRTRYEDLIFSRIQISPYLLQAMRERKAARLAEKRAGILAVEHEAPVKE